MAITYAIGRALELTSGLLTGFGQSRTLKSSLRSTNGGSFIASSFLEGMGSSLV